MSTLELRMAKMTIARCEGNAAYWTKKAAELKEQEAPKSDVEPVKAEIPDIDITGEETPDASGNINITACPYCGERIEQAENTCHNCKQPIAWAELIDSPDYVVCDQCGYAEKKEEFAGACRRCGYAG